jgi:mono/diheme cytochrome c family protein
LTSLPPAQISSTPPALTASAHADDLDIAIDITPGRVGVNTFTLNVSANGRPIENARAVELRFAPVALNVPPSQAQLAGLGGGRYSTKGAYLSLPGRWQVQAVVRREDRFDAFAEFNFEVGATGAAPSFAWSQAAGILLVVAALVYAYALGSRSRGRVQLAVVGFAPALALIAVGYAVFNTPSGQNADLVNPIPPNAASVDAGRAIYQEMCVPCHGVAGKGDGPVGLTLNPRPADLTLHAVPGVHTDGQLYEWITGGFPGSVMPAFKDRLSDDDRWNAVNFIRTLAPK